jgi:hypothetical protein
MEKKKFYRVCSPETLQGLWYTFNGEFTGLIHGKFDFCMNSELKMDYDPDLVGYLSAVPELKMLWKWFSKEDILQLQKHKFYIYEFEATDYWFYDRFQHFVICQETSIIVQRIEIQ